VHAGSADSASRQGGATGVRDGANATTWLASAGAQKNVQQRLTDQETEGDEMLQNAGAQGTP